MIMTYWPSYSTTSSAASVYSCTWHF